jgi:hypothetical protein
MATSPDGHPNPICGTCGEEFATAEQLGDHVDAVHRVTND